jgi:PRTRC genetic system ThiF family protein
MIGRYEPRHAVRHIVLVGVGGTGSALARSIARMLYDMDRRGMHLPKMTLIDPDIIEERNVGRQSGFAPSDVGQSKAAVLSRRFNLALGLNIEAIAAPFDPEDHHTTTSTLLVGCVDNHEARQALARANCLCWLDTGNSRQNGQIVCGSTGDRDRALKALERMPHNDGALYELPNATLIFPDLLEPEPEPETAPDISCAERVAAGEQHLLINDCMATAAASYVWKLLHHQPLHHFMTYVSLAAVRPVGVSAAEIRHYLA